MKFSLSISFLLAFLLAGCSIFEDYDGTCDERVKSPTINLTFNLSAPSGRGTRADSAGHDEQVSDDPDFEDRIYMNDFAFFVFAELPDGTKPFITKFDSKSPSDDPFTDIWQMQDHYYVRVAIPKDEFENIVPKVSGNDNVTLRVVAIANTYDAYTRFTSGYDTFDNFIRSANDWTFRMSHIYSGTGGSVTDARIPMFGMSTMTAPRANLYASDLNNPLSGGEIHMLRALAKVKVIDGLSTTGYPHIQSVHFQGTNNTAYVLPHDAANYLNGHQVETSRPTAVTTNGTDWTMSKNLVDNSWYIYVPEQMLNTGDRPQVVIEVAYKENSTSQEIDKFTVPLHGYNDQVFTDFGDAILRNHIYTIRFGRSDVNGKIKVDVADWYPMPDLNLDYTETVTADGGITWTNYDDFDSTEGMLVLKPWSDTYTGGLEWEPLHGEFTLTSPIGAKWTASILTEEGDPVFRFLSYDQYGDVVPVSNISGTIDRYKYEFDIVSLESQPQAKNSAKLQIVVTLPNGMVLPFPNGSDKFTIVQNPL